MTEIITRKPAIVDNSPTEEAVVDQQPVVTDSTTANTYQFTRFIYYILALLETLLILRLILKILAANPRSGFTSLIYTLSQIFLLPFKGIFPTAATGGSVFEPSVIVALIVYPLLAWGITELIKILVKR